MEREPTSPADPRIWRGHTVPTGVGVGRLGLLLLAAAFASCGEAPKPVGGSGRFVDERPGEPFRHLVVQGTPYEMGFHQGRLLARELRADRYLFIAEAALKGLDVYVPEFVRLLPVALADELRGMAAASGVPFDDLVRREVEREVLRWNASAPDARRASFASAPGASPAVACAFDLDRDAAGDGSPGVSLPGQARPLMEPLPLLVERRPTGGVATLVLGEPGSLGGLAGISSRGVVIVSCEDDSLPSERRSLRGLPFAAGLRLALEMGTDAETAFAALPRLVGNRVLVADAANRRIDALVGLSVVGLVRSDPNAWVLRAAGEDAVREKQQQAQEARLGTYPSRPGPKDAIDLVVAGRKAESTFPPLLWSPSGLEVRDAAGKTWVYAWSK